MERENFAGCSPEGYSGVTEGNTFYIPIHHSFDYIAHPNSLINVGKYAAAQKKVEGLKRADLGLLPVVMIICNTQKEIKGAINSQNNHTLGLHTSYVITYT